jgi:BirA family biotin operon repressor/biotin-[acetyl-CoA-carboxylase] ligase
MGSRDPLDAAAIQAASGDRWARVAVVAEVGSTNAELLGDNGAPDRSVLVAELQTAGRGRFDRSWQSPRGAGLTFSVLLRPPLPMSRWGWLPLLAGVALAESVRRIVPGLEVALKWPNDVLLALPDGGSFGKAAGILAQTAEDAVVIGIGLNVDTTAEELPAPTATSLRLCGTDTDRHGRAELLVEALARLDARYAQFCDVGGDADACGLAADYRELCATIGSGVTVDTGGTMLRGRAIDVDPGGRLVVDDGDRQHSIAAGDVTLR